MFYFFWFQASEEARQAWKAAKKVGQGPGRSLGNTAVGHLARPLLSYSALF